MHCNRKKEKKKKYNTIIITREGRRGQKKRNVVVSAQTKIKSIYLPSLSLPARPPLNKKRKEKPQAAQREKGGEGFAGGGSDRRHSLVVSMEYAAPAGAGGYYYYPPSQQHKPRRPPRPAARWVKHWYGIHATPFFSMIDVLLLIISCGWFCIAGSRRISPPPPANAPSTSGSGVIFSSLPLIFPQIFFTTLQHYITCACLVSIDFFLSLCVRAEDVYKNLKDGKAVPEPEAVKPEPTTEILFLCSYENCGKTFVDVAALRKHAHVHNERQYICQEPGCGKVVSPHFAPTFFHVSCSM